MSMWETGLDPKGRNRQNLTKMETTGNDYKVLCLDIKIRLHGLKVARHGLASLRTPDRDRLESAI